MRTRPRLTDRMLPLVVGAVQVASNYGAQANQPGRLPVDLLGTALLLVGPLALAARRSHPVLALAVTLASTFAFVARGHAYGPIFFSPLIALHFTVVLGHRRTAWAASAVAYAFLVAYTTWLAPVPSPGLWHDLGIAAVLGTVLAVGEFARARTERAAERARVVAEESRRQVSEERLTMAQELHDVLAHNISLIHVQASTALHLIDDHPEQARTALTAIKQASKDVLTEMRSLIGVLRDDAPRSPTAGLDGLEELAGRSGLDVTRRVTGRARPLPSGVDLAGYRIVQESLTNVVRHAPGSAVEVLLEYGARELLVRVTDSGDGTPAESLGGGNGIPGMKERAAALGGTLAAGRHGRGFRVEARLPIPEEAPRPSEETSRTPEETP
ncbi:sensor histidine kinase [Planomonospora venezuelensis]|uniref:histidine kinase n=1 Tax=Planomonospora venezuelensis TaxID=1999 RepID=A0A841CVQ8_PLAVE|nr:signal transduction histidine kinase [Planomonospora venezuelensis]GIN00081.1 two-component sensor histidine kinase [Planomonospora venezuelensis]